MTFRQKPSTVLLSTPHHSRIANKPPGIGLLILVCISLLWACEYSIRPTETMLPTAIGQSDEVLLLLDKSHLEDTLGAVLLDRFSADFTGLPQSEPVLQVNPKPYDAFGKILKKYHNIIIVAPLDEQNTISTDVRKALGKNLEKAKTNPSFFYAVRRNVWAEPQLVLYVFAPDMNSLLQNLHDHSTKIVQKVLTSENPAILKNYLVPGKHRQLMAKVREKFGFHLTIPADFEASVESEDFLWIRREATDLSQNVLIYTQALDSSTLITAAQNNGIRIRDQLGAEYIKGQLENTYMMSDTVIPIFSREIKLDGLLAYENRGLWRLKGDFMGGPFLNYYILDEPNNRLILLDGFVHAPKLKKKLPIRQLEVLFATFKQVP